LFSCLPEELRQCQDHDREAAGLGVQRKLERREYEHIAWGGHMIDRYDPDGLRLPIKVDSTSNGEFAPRPLGTVQNFANRLAHDRASENARRLGLSRRRFLLSACGAATTLLAFNDAHAAAGMTAGFYEMPRDAGLDPDFAKASLEGQEFIFDVQGHHVSPLAKWRNKSSPWASMLSYLPQAQCHASGGNKPGDIDCLTQNVFIKDMFLDSDTQIAVLSFVPSTPHDEPLSMEEAAETRAIVESLKGNHRLLLHGRVIPILDADYQRMSELQERWGISAWKTYTQFGRSWWLDDDKTGIPFLEKVRASGLKLVCIHKGIPLPPQGTDNLQFSSCRDVGPAAKLFPDITFIIYHSGFDPDIAEGPYRPGHGGIDTLIQSLHESGIAPNGNVYAELGSTWRFLMGRPDQAAHMIGKLLKHVGTDNVVWGTDSIWYGSPQDQIQAFRSFQIAEDVRERYGYPKITPEIRAKIFGLNAARAYKLSPNLMKKASLDGVGRAKAAYLEDPNPHFSTLGPRTKREFLDFWRFGGHS
jgi:predicted TIM-barrel fold metal-dependent hydrolase